MLRTLLLALFLTQQAFCIFNEPLFNFVEKNLTHYGTLQQTADQFVYVKVDDDYIHKLIEFIGEEGFVEPPYFGRDDLVGAHITVINRFEMQEHHIKCIHELGACIFFKPLCLKVVENNERCYYILEVEAKRLETIRCRYGLPKAQYPFHITIGVKEKQLLTH